MLTLNNIIKPFLKQQWHSRDYDSTDHTQTEYHPSNQRNIYLQNIEQVTAYRTLY